MIYLDRSSKSTQLDTLQSNIFYYRQHKEKVSESKAATSFSKWTKKENIEKKNSGWLTSVCQQVYADNNCLRVTACSEK